jgi:hypothetical protein
VGRAGLPPVDEEAPFLCDEIAMTDSSDNRPGVEAQHVNAEHVTLEGGSAYVIKAGQAALRQSAASTVYAETVDLRESAVGWAESDLVRADLGAVGVAQTETLAADQSVVGVVRASHATLNQAIGGVVAAERIEATNTRAFIVFGREINGSVYTWLDVRGAAVFGALAGLAVGAVLLLGGMFGRRR